MSFPPMPKIGKIYIVDWGGWDSLIGSLGPTPYHVGCFEEFLIELGPRAHMCEVEENDGFPFWHPWEKDEDHELCPTCGGSGVLTTTTEPEPWPWADTIMGAG